ncbi:MAG: hypothetical protein WCI79_00070 [Candidatus Saccharibacteria bacterium]
MRKVLKSIAKNRVVAVIGRFAIGNRRMLIVVFAMLAIVLPVGFYARESNVSNKQEVLNSDVQRIDNTQTLDTVNQGSVYTKTPEESSDNDQPKQSSNSGSSRYTGQTTTPPSVPPAAPSDKPAPVSTPQTPINTPVEPPEDNSGLIALCQEINDTRAAMLAPVRQQIAQKTQELADLPATIDARTAGTLITEAQKQRLIALESATIMDQLNALQSQLSTLSYQYPAC